MAGSRRQQQQQQQQAATGKVSIAMLVRSGLLVAGNTVVCNSWPFSAVVTPAGTFTAQWQPLPPDFIAGHGTEFMKAEFETPSAWATAVCRVMRAQQRAQRTAEDGGRGRGRQLPSTGGSGESRVAVNGWTACRVRVAPGDANRRLALRLDAEARDVTGGGDADDAAGAVEVSLDVLRRELSSRLADSGSESDAADHASAGGVDGLARRVEDGLALGCVTQRKAAAAAAGAISAAAGAPAVSAVAKPHSRKRKSNPDMSRQAKLSRVPAEDDSEVGDGRALEQLARFRERAGALQRPAAEARALRYQRRQRLRRAMAGALDDWLHRRRQGRADAARSLGSLLGALALATRPPSPVQPGSAMPAPQPGGMQPAADIRRTRVLVPRDVLRTRAASLAALCTLCASAGGAMLACAACGDRYHAFCAPAPQPGSGRFLCTGCRVCSVCMSGEFADELLQCDGCGLLVHEQCSGQAAGHAGGLLGLVADNGGRWLCDGCVECRECAYRMPARELITDADAQRVQWAYDFSLCGTCAAQIEKARVCAECLATYANATVGASMVCCDVCAFWVHTECDASLTPAVYDALIALEDDAPYVCPTCMRVEAVPRTCFLPLCLRTADEGSAGGTAFGELRRKETEEEAADMLLSLTRSDVRFGSERFDVAAMEARLCVADDWRACMLCGLHGDGVVVGRRRPVLGRLVPVASGGGGSGVCSAWAHVECLAWAWGPRAVGVPGDDSAPALVRFEGMLVDREGPAPVVCTLCGRPGASLHCCAPVACNDAAYHLPCLLVAGWSTKAEAVEPASSGAAEEPRYCGEWRRALCPEHAPVFSAMMPQEGSVAAPVYDDVCVLADIANMPSAADSQGFVVFGNLVLLGGPGDGGGRGLVRFFSVDGVAYGLYLCRDGADGWCGCVGRGLDGDVTVVPGGLRHDKRLGDLLGRLLRDALPDESPRAAFLAALAASAPHRFLKLPLPDRAPDE